MDYNQLLKGYVKDEMDVPDGAIIIMEGRKSEWAFVILKGRAKVKQKTASGTVILETLGEGAVIGEMALLDDRHSVGTASVVADGPVRLAVLERQAILRDYESMSPQFRQTMQAVLLHLREASSEVKELAGRSG